MLEKIYSNKESFKEITFTKGLNLIIGDSDEKSTQDDTCNGIGKTTLINLIDFCQGADKDKKKIAL